MHELGVVFAIIRQVDDLAEENHASTVGKVTVRLGEVSTVIPKYMEDLWRWACDNRSKHMKGCELELETIEALTYCEDCHNVYRTIDYGKTCPKCHSENTYLKQGNEVEIQSIEVLDEPPEATPQDEK